MTRGGNLYAIVFHDDCTRSMWVYFLANKNDASRALDSFISDTCPDGSVEIL